MDRMGEEQVEKSADVLKVGGVWILVRMTQLAVVLVGWCRKRIGGIWRGLENKSYENRDVETPGGNSCARIGMKRKT